MARKIRFPLEMGQGVDVRSLEELREKFSLSHVLMYISNGKLVTWLRDRYEDDIADEIEKLDSSDSDLSKKVCEIFDVQYDESADEDIEKIKEKSERLRLLKEYTSEQKYFDVEEKIAFNQDELYDLLDDGITEIYLCGEQFSIPLAKFGISYYGINNPTVVINSKEEVDWEEKGILLEDVTYDEKYTELLKSNKGIKEVSISNDGILRIVDYRGNIKESKYYADKIVVSNNQYAILAKKGSPSVDNVLAVNLLNQTTVNLSQYWSARYRTEKLQLYNEYLVMCGKTLNLDTGELLKVQHLGNLHNRNVGEESAANYIIYDGKIIYAIYEYRHKNSSVCVFDIYMCDINWQNQRLIYQIEPYHEWGEDSLFLDCIEIIENSKLKVNIHRGSYYSKNRLDGFVLFDIEEEVQKSMDKVTSIYVNSNIEV